MGVLTKKPKTFEVQFSDPNKSAYSGGDKVAGQVIVEVAEVVQVSAVKLLGIGCAKVDYNKGKMQCRDEIEYLKYEEVLHLDHQPTGEQKLWCAISIGHFRGHFKLFLPSCQLS